MVDTNVPCALVLPIGKLYFGYPVVPLRNDGGDASNPTYFSGEGNTLRKKNKS